MAIKFNKKDLFAVGLALFLYMSGYVFLRYDQKIIHECYKVNYYITHHNVKMELGDARHSRQTHGMIIFALRVMLFQPAMFWEEIIYKYSYLSNRCTPENN